MIRWGNKGGQLVPEGVQQGNNVCAHKRTPIKISVGARGPHPQLPHACCVVSDLVAQSGVGSIRRTHRTYVWLCLLQRDWGSRRAFSRGYSVGDTGKRHPTKLTRRPSRVPSCLSCLLAAWGFLVEPHEGGGTR